MHTVAQTPSAIFVPLMHASSMLAGGFSRLACTPLGSFGLAAAVIVSLVLASICGAWATLERLRSIRHRRRLIATVRRLHAGIHFRNALLDSLSETTVVLKFSPRTALSFAGGKKLLRHCLAGPDAKQLATSIDALLKNGSAFNLVARTIGIRNVNVRGAIIRRRPVISLRYQSENAKPVDKRCAVNEGPVANVAHENRVIPMARAEASQGQALPEREKNDALTEALKTRPGAQNEGIVTIGPDGRVRGFNQAFVDRWSLKDDRLRAEPRLDEVVRWCHEASGRDTIWDVVRAAIASPEPERYDDWSVPVGNNGRHVSPSFSRLRDGGTRIAFRENRAPFERAA